VLAGRKEVVEHKGVFCALLHRADTPSTRIASAIHYKLLIINLLPFASITSGNVPRNGQ
jgi:hypothetical protein